MGIRGALWVSALLGAASHTGCEASKKEAPAPSAGARTKAPSVGQSTTAYSVPERTERALRQALTHSCLRAQAANKPVLLEFSAAWCGDCRRLAKMKAHPTLARALEAFEVVVVNVGEFDRHGWLQGPFAVRTIARWEVLGASECQAPAHEWERLGGRTLEPTRPGQELTPRRLASWLDGKRAQAQDRL